MTSPSVVQFRDGLQLHIDVGGANGVSVLVGLTVDEARQLAADLEAGALRVRDHRRPGTVRVGENCYPDGADRADDER